MHQNKKLNIFLHDVYDNKKIEIEIKDDIKISDVKKKFAEENSINLNTVRVRLLYGGVELKDENFIYQYNMSDGFIIQILKVNL